MAFTSAQSTVFSAQLSAYIQQNLQFSKAVNYSWQPEAQRNKVVTINALTSPTVYTFVPGQTAISGSDVAYTSQNLTLDQYRYFNVSVDDVLRATSTVVSMDPIVRAGGYELAFAQDQYIASLWTSVTGSNIIATVAAPFNIINGATESATTGSAYDAAVNLKVKLDSTHAPLQDRFLIAPSWFVSSIQKDDRFASFDPEVRKQGIIGTVAGMTVLQSEAVISGSVSNIWALQREHIAFASGLESFESIRSENTFATKLRALSVYGAKTIVPSYGAICHAKAGA